MAVIYTGNGRAFYIDYEDYGLVSKYKWSDYSGYAKRRVWIPDDGKFKLQGMEALILGVETDNNFYIDHIDRNPQNNRRNNLRFATPTLNQANSKLNRRNTSGFRGVSWSKKSKKWVAQIGGKCRKHLGFFDNKIEAALAYDKAAYELWGRYAKLNFPITNF